MRSEYFMWVFCLLLTSSAAAALAHDGEVAESAVVPFEERILKLEKDQVEIYHTLSGKKEAGLAGRITERITLSGLLEVEGAAERLKFRGAGSDSASDLSLATAQLFFAAEVNGNVTGVFSLLFEEGETDLEVDEATIDFASGVWTGRLGRQYLPFGVFYSHFISDPLTLELGETRDTALLVGFGNEVINWSGFVFQGAAGREGGERHLEDWGTSLVMTPVKGLSLGGSYLSDLADSDADLLGGANWRRRVGGWSAFAIWESGPFDLSGEILGAVRSFNAEDGGFRPRAWNLEAAYDIRENMEIAIRYEKSREFPDQPARQYGIDLSWSPWERVSLSLEYLRGEFDRDFSEADDSGRELEKRDMVTAQVALEF